MKRISILAVVAVAVAMLVAANRASAADLPVRPGPPAYYPVATVYDWGGGYIGVNGGYAFGKSEWSDSQNPSGNSSSGNFNVNGGLVGITAGVSGQWNAFVLGVEGDFDWQGLKGTSNSSYCTSIFTSSAVGATAGGLGCQTQSNWLGTFRVRAGYAWDRVLLYGTAGLAGANVEAGLSGLPPQNHFEFGWTAGAGLEWAFADNWTAKVEYLFVDFTSPLRCNHSYSCGFDQPTGANTLPVNGNNAVTLNENLIRVGVNFKFGH